MLSTACALHFSQSAIVDVIVEMRENTACGLPLAVFRANPCPEDTNLLCRLPLPAVFYKQGAANLGDLMRMSVRERVH